jgi:hypothetical protein
VVGHSVSGNLLSRSSETWSCRSTVHSTNRKRQKPCGSWRLLTVILSLIGSCIDHLCLSIELRVGRILDLPAQPWLRFQVAPSPLPLAEPASDSDGCPSSSSLRLCRRSPFEFPRTSDAFSAAGFCGVPGFPGGARSSCIACDTVLRLPLVPYLRLYRRWIVESPRFSHLSAVPVVKAPGCPFALHPRYRRRSVSGSPQMLILRSRLTSVPSRLGVPCHPVAPFESPDCSVYSLRASSFGHSPSRPGSCSLNAADSVCFESPRNFLTRLIRICFRRLRLLPHLRLSR